MKTLGIEKAKQYDRSYNSKISRTKSQVLYLVDDRTSGSIALPLRVSLQWRAIQASFNQTKQQWSLLFLPFAVLLFILLFSQSLISYLLMSPENVLWLQVIGGVLEAPFMAFAVVVGFRLFSLTSQRPS